MCSIIFNEKLQLSRQLWNIMPTVTSNIRYGSHRIFILSFETGVMTDNSIELVTFVSDGLSTLSW